MVDRGWGMTMRLYSATSKQFIQDTVTNQISEKLKSSFFNQYRFEPSPAEIRSWQNSLRAMSQAIEHAKLMDHGILLEYQLPLSSRRLDCMVCGHDADEKPNSVIVELKQWDGCSDAEGDNYANTVLNSPPINGTIQEFENGQMLFLRWVILRIDSVHTP